MSLKVYVVTSDRYTWALRPFAYLFNVYWSSLQPVVVAGYARPNFELPKNFRFHQIARTEYPPELWSNALIKFLKDMPDPYFVMMLEDYWICRTVDTGGIAAAYDYIRSDPNILKIDLTNDRLHRWDGAPEIIDYDYYGHYDIILSPKGIPYRMSMQSAIWNRELLLKILEPNKNPWETEMQIDPPPEMLVLGTRQFPLHYANAVLKGAVVDYEVKRIPEPHRANISQWIPNGWKVTVPA